MEQLASLGVDIGSILTKGILLSEDGQVSPEEYLWMEGDPVGTVKWLVSIPSEKAPGPVNVCTVDTTGFTWWLIGNTPGAGVVKNEITTHVVGTLSRHPGMRTILEIGGQDSEIILIRGGVIPGYAMNMLYVAGAGALLSSQAKRLGFEVESLGDLILRSQLSSKIAARCIVFVGPDMVHKTQTGHSKGDTVAGLHRAVVLNYLNNVGKGKRIEESVVLQGGVSKNRGIVWAFEEELHSGVTVDPESHLMDVIGAATLSRSASREWPSDSSLLEMTFTTKAGEYSGCPNRCEIVRPYRGDELPDARGNHCEKGLDR